MKLSRKRQKEETRQKLLDAAGAELASGRSFDTLSLREVAKLAGIAPTSFYRHFHDMEGLGLALIEEHGAGLLTLMHRVREQAAEGRSVIRASVETLFDYIFSNQGVSRMILQESMARESAFHKAAEKLFVTLSRDLAEFLVYDTVLSLVEREAVERYLLEKYPPPPPPWRCRSRGRVPPTSR